MTTRLSLTTFALLAFSFLCHGREPRITTVSPAEEQVVSGTATALRVALTAPGSGTTLVTFFGRETAPAKPGPDFTVIALPDTQFYCQNTGGNRASFFSAQTQWVVENRDKRNIAFVSHMGDIVQDGENSGNPAQWKVADAAMRLLEDPAKTLRPDGIPWGCAPGNHDYSPNGDANGKTTLFNQYFGAQRWAGRSYYGGHFGSDNNNNYALFSASGLDFIVIHLAYDGRGREAQRPVLQWADGLLKAYPNRRAIVTSHWILNSGNPAAFSPQGQNIYDALKGNPNLFLMLCGHVHGEGRRADTFEGHTVYSVLQDYQSLNNGGDGFLRIFTFSPGRNQIVVQSYSPVLDRAINPGEVPGAAGEFALPYDMQGAVADWKPLGSAALAAGGTAAALEWNGLEAGARYEWYAVSGEEGTTVSSGTGRFAAKR